MDKVAGWGNASVDDVMEIPSVQWTLLAFMIQPAQDTERVSLRSIVNFENA
jgi:hypothetical protein